jgi:hypothetical protein
MTISLDMLPPAPRRSQRTPVDGAQQDTRTGKRIERRKLVLTAQPVESEAFDAQQSGIES